MMTLPTLQFELDVAELSYALATVGAKAVWGLDAQLLFPASATARQALYDQGFAQLQADGWLQPAANNTWEIDPNLLWVIAIVANPQIVSITTRYLQPEGQQVAIHYLYDQSIVELAYTQAGKYRFTTLPDQPSVLTRIGSVVAPATETADLPPTVLELPAQLFETLGPVIQAKQLAQAKIILQEAGVSEQQTSLLITILTRARRCAAVELSRTLPDEILGSYEIILLQTSSGYWQMRAGDLPDTIVFEAITAARLAERLVMILEELRKIEVAPQPR